MLARLDDHGRRLDDGRGGVAGLEPEVVGRLARHQRDDPKGAADHVDLGHDGVALDRDDGALQPVARTRERCRAALSQQF